MTASPSGPNETIVSLLQGRLPEHVARVELHRQQPGPGNHYEIRPPGAIIQVVYLVDPGNQTTAADPAWVAGAWRRYALHLARIAAVVADAADQVDPPTSTP